ncbi:hypothetical protein [Shinella zoogloeoides]|uniref:hypothetical protein n=1 Tax=Shinella zoogloeoides TaxID=352475 RepID=UPI0028A6463C|nr:hypothetical protein [Shinella zoogloeoides]
MAFTIVHFLPRPPAMERQRACARYIPEKFGRFQPIERGDGRVCLVPSGLRMMGEDAKKWAVGNRGP